MTIYKGQLAKSYDIFFSNLNDFEFYKYFIEKNNGTALEIGSGTGRLFLKYLNLGLKIEGLEPNQDMIDICKQKATPLKLSPTIYQQELQKMAINKKFKTIYMPLFVFQNILQNNEILDALQNCYDNLDDKGQVLISIFTPWNDPTGTLEQTWRISKIINQLNKNYVLSESITFDKFEQIQTKYLKYELFQDQNLIETFFSEIKFRFYSRFELTMLLEKVGFKNIEVFGDYTFQEAYSENEVFIFSAYK